MGQAPVILALALLFVPSLAKALEASQSGVSVDFRDCAKNPVGRSVFFSALALELPPAEHGPTEIDVSLACDDIAEIRIRVGAVERARAVSFDDVPSDQRARALALVVAELFRSAADEIGGTTHNDAAAAGTTPGAAAAVKAGKATPPPAAANRGAPPVVAAESGSASAARVSSAARGLRAVMGASLRVVPHGPLWGLDGGIEHGPLCAQAEVWLARSVVERGSITSGIAALRAGPRLAFLRAGRVTSAFGVSVGGGVTWSVGASTIPGTFVQEVLKPYVDARLELMTSIDVSEQLKPDISLFAGRASGINAESDGQIEQSTGGWFAGLRLGAAL